METLYKLTNDFKELLDLAGSADPEEQQIFNDTLEAVLGAIEVKADGYAVVMSEIEGRCNIISAEINRLKAIEDSLTATHKRMKDRLKNAMEEIGTTEIKTDLHKFKIVKNGGQLPLIIDGGVPENFKRIEYTDDKEKIRKALDNGEALTFAHYGDRGTHLKID